MMKNDLVLKVSVAVGYVIMVWVNYLANALPIAGVTTAEASDALANLFTPAGVTFSIWGLIYALLLVYTIHQFGFWQKEVNSERETFFATVNRYFLVTSLANIAWIFAWHYGIVWLSLVIMFVLLTFLIKIADVVNKRELATVDVLCVRAPFSIYFGWITVATIANVTVFLVSIGWDRFGLSESMWTMIIILVGAGIGAVRMWKDANIFYGAVFVWAYAGIWFKHMSASGFNGAYPGVIVAVVFCMAVFLGMIGVLGYDKIMSRTAVKS